MYLKEMGGVELLSREGEIAIAKRKFYQKKFSLEQYMNVLAIDLTNGKRTKRVRNSYVIL